jgi:hypothetical protein
MIRPRLLPLLLTATSLSQPVFAQINPFPGRATVPLRVGALPLRGSLWGSPAVLDPSRTDDRSLGSPDMHPVDTEDAQR